MSRNLHRLIYHSRNLIDGPPGALLNEIEGILRVSRRNNALAGITGALMFNSGSFAQILEGPSAPVFDLFERIQRDERHADATLLFFGQVATRAFPHWSMAFVGQSATEERLFAGVNAGSDFDDDLILADHLFGRLYALVHDGWRTGPARSFT